MGIVGVPVAIQSKGADIEFAVGIPNAKSQSTNVHSKYGKALLLVCIIPLSAKFFRLHEGREKKVARLSAAYHFEAKETAVGDTVRDVRFTTEWHKQCEQGKTC